jgi:hypothetical protein
MASLVGRCTRCAKRFVPAVFALGQVTIASATDLSAMTEWGYIETFSAWSNDSIFVHHSAPPLQNLSWAPYVVVCPVMDGGYSTAPSDPGHRLLHAAIIGAYLHHKQVRFRLSYCANNKPRIVSVDVQD